MNDENEKPHIPQEELDKLRDPLIVAKQRELGVTFQEVLGYSNEQMESFYHIARNLFDRQEYRESGDAFIFLTTLNPYTCTYWIGLGMCEQLSSRIEAALLAYSMAILANNSNPIPHYHSATCYCEIGNVKSAISSLKYAIMRAGVKEKYAKLKKQAQSKLDSLETSD